MEPLYIKLCINLTDKIEDKIEKETDKKLHYFILRKIRKLQGESLDFLTDDLEEFFYNKIKYM